jgi:hypothetical protein
MISNEYIYEVPEEKFSLDSSDIEYLEQLKENRKDNAIKYLEKADLVMSSGYFQWHLKYGTEEEKNENNKLFLKLQKLFQFTTNNNTVEKIVDNLQLARVPADLKIHVDYRSAILTIPLVDLTNPITFWSSRDEDREILFQYHYTKYKPLIVNTLVEHNVINNNEDRIFLQLGGFKLKDDEDFNTLVANV